MNTYKIIKNKYMVIYEKKFDNFLKKCLKRKNKIIKNNFII